MSWFDDRKWLGGSNTRVIEHNPRPIRVIISQLMGLGLADRHSSCQPPVVDDWLCGRKDKGNKSRQARDRSTLHEYPSPLLIK